MHALIFPLDDARKLLDYLSKLLSKIFFHMKTTWLSIAIKNSEIKPNEGENCMLLDILYCRVPPTIGFQDTVA